jgi:hypothetical protein
MQPGLDKKLNDSLLEISKPCLQSNVFSSLKITQFFSLWFKFLFVYIFSFDICAIDGGCVALAGEFERLRFS